MAKSRLGGDARLKRTSEQGHIDPAEDRASASAAEQEEGRDSRLDVDEDLVDDWDFDRLPKLPDIPGFRTIWLSTQHPQDTIPQRMRLGYTPVTLDEAPELKSLTAKEGPYQGLLTCREMVAFKLPVKLWQKYMTRFHHTKPLDEESAIRELVRTVEEQAKDAKGHLHIEKGTDELGKGPARAIFN